MSKIVIILLTLGMLLIAYFTYQTHLNAINSYRLSSSIDKAIAAYDYVDLQIRNAYQQTLLNDLTHANADISQYFESEEKIYRKLTEIDTLTAAFANVSLPSDSLRPLVARQFLRIERFRMRDDRSNDSLTTAMLNASLDDQERIVELIETDKQQLYAAGGSMADSGILTPAFIFFLFAFGAGTFIYAYTTLTQTRFEIEGVEEKLRKNQEILYSEMKDHEHLQLSHKMLLDLSEEIWVILEPTYEQAEPVDFHVRHANEKAGKFFHTDGESSIKQLLNARFDKAEANDFLDWLLECFEGHHGEKKDIQVKEGQEVQDMAFYAVPVEGNLYLKGLDQSPVKTLENAGGGLRQEADILFDIPNLLVAELDPQGRIVRTNHTFGGQDNGSGRKYIWELIKPGDEAFKKALRNRIHLLPEKGFMYSDDQYRIYGIRNKKGGVDKVIYVSRTS